MNADLNSSISHLHRIPNSDGHTSKIRAIPNDEDAEMTDGDRFLNANEGRRFREHLWLSSVGLHQTRHHAHG